MPRDTRNRPAANRAAPVVESASESTPTPIECGGWETIDSKIGPEYGASYRGHAIDVAEFGGAWHWSATHPRLCRLRGACGTEPDRLEAQRAALRAVDGWGCARRVVA
jgi:hypothetical protein